MSESSALKHCARCKAPYPADEFRVFPSKKRRGVYCRDCERALAREYYWRNKLGASSMPEAHRKAISESGKAVWASGSRKPETPEANIRRSETRKRLYATGRISKPDPIHMRKVNAAIDRERQAEINRASGLRRVGSRMPPGAAGRGVEHWKAKYWEVVSPDRKMYRFVNLLDFVRENEWLFAPEDVVWKGPRCRASSGLASMFGRKGKSQWKGWRPVKQEEKPA